MGNTMMEKPKPNARAGGVGIFVSRRELNFPGN
jgi:hypothetical protein